MPLVPDKSGGFFVLSYVSPVDTTYHRFHIEPFSAASLEYTGTLAGGEATVNDTVVDLISYLAAFLPSDTGINLASIWQTSSGGTVVTEIFSTSTTVGGSNGTGSTSGVKEVAILTVSARDTQGYPWRTQIPRPTAADWNADSLGVRSEGNTAADAPGNLANYLTRYLSAPSGDDTTGGFTRINSHNGKPLAGRVQFVSGLSKRLRRRFRVI